MKEVRLAAKTAKDARREITHRWPKLDVEYKGFDHTGNAVLISMVRKQGDKASVATAYRNRSSRAVSFIALVPDKGE